MGGPEQIALLYDADCGFCRWSIAQVLRWDRRGRVVPVRIQSPDGERLLAGVPMADRLESWHLVTADGGVRSAGAVFAPLLQLLPGGWVIAWLPARLPGPADWAYRIVARNRSSVSRLVPRDQKAAADARITSRERSIVPPVTGGSC